MENSIFPGLVCKSNGLRITQTKSELEKTKKTLKSVKLSVLPDKGARLKQKIVDLENLLHTLSLDSEKPEEVTKITKTDYLEKVNKDETNCLEKSKPLDVASTISTSGDIPTTGSKSETLPKNEAVTTNISFSDLAKTNGPFNESVVQSPSFTGWRDPVHSIPYQSVKEKIASYRFPVYKIAPLIDVKDESVKKIQQSLVTYPDDTLEEEDPENLKTSLMMHQRKALAWLMWREEQDPSGGILADDMGLGKTLTVISLILKQKEICNYLVSKKEDKSCRGTLIICLASIIHQWHDEINKHCNHDALNVLVYHGSNREKSFKYMSKYNVVLTTYNIVMAEKKALDSKKQESPLFALNWERIVLDEAHNIKNHTSQTAQAVFSLKGCRRWAVTGTPIHNMFKDLYSLVKFLQVSPFDDYKKFKKLTDDLSEFSEKRKQLLIKSICLRRTKDEEDEKGAPIVKMKHKSFTVHNIELSEGEQKIYDKVDEKITKKFDKYTLMKSKVKPTNLLVLLLRLQQCCSHIGLLRSDIEDDDILSDVTKGLSSLSLDDKNSSSTESSLDLTLSELDNENLCDKKLKSSKIDKLFEELKKISSASANKEKSVIVSQWVSMLDIVAFHLEQEKIAYYLIAGSTKASDRQKHMDDFNKKDSVKIMLLSLKAGGVGLNLTGANHLFLLDLHWNPALEMQACDRIHRVGQEKDVMIHKFICKDTVEEKILSLQEKKKEIASDALHGVKHNTKGLTFEDFKALFNVKA